MDRWVVTLGFLLSSAIMRDLDSSLSLPHTDEFTFSSAWIVDLLKIMHVIKMG